MYVGGTPGRAFEDGTYIHPSFPRTYIPDFPGRVFELYRSEEGNAGGEYGAELTALEKQERRDQEGQQEGRRTAGCEGTADSLPSYLGILEGDFTFATTNAHVTALAEFAKENFLGQHVADLLHNQAAQRPRTKGRIIALRGQPLAGSRS